MFRSDSAELGVGPSFVPVYSIARPMEGCSGDVQLFRSSTAKTTCWVRNILPRVRFHALLRRLLRSMVQCMTRLQILDSRTFSCLLYTSDAADDLLCVDLGGRRII